MVRLTLLKEAADPEKWTREELRRWLAAVSPINILAPARPLWYFYGVIPIEGCLCPHSQFESPAWNLAAWYKPCHVRSWRKWECTSHSIIVLICFIQRNLHPSSKDTDEQLLERVKANMRTPKAASWYIWNTSYRRIWRQYGSWVRKHIGIQFKVSSSLVLASSYLAGVIRDSAYIVQLARTPRSSIYTSLCYRGYFLNLCIIYLNLMASATLRSAVSVIREVLSTRQYQYSQYLQRSPDTFKKNRKWDYHCV